MKEKDFLVKKIQEYVSFLEVYEKLEPEKIIIDKDFFSSGIDNEIYNKKKSEREGEKLNKFKDKPVLYWFTFPDEFNEQEELYNFYNTFIIENKVKEYRRKEDYNFREKLVYRRAFSAIKTRSNIDFTTNTLYVGKVESGIWGRLAVHSGWGTSPKTAGLQLPYWYDFEKYGNLTFNYIVLEKSMKYFVEVLEKELRKELKPLIGKK